jgi:hypothetical protein
MVFLRPRHTIAEQNGIGAGTVTSIIANYKAGLESLDFDSVRRLSAEARQHGLNLSELACILYRTTILSNLGQQRTK